jgi:hypothetical protein
VSKASKWVRASKEGAYRNPPLSDIQSYGNAHQIEQRLTRFLEDARIPLDNNATERGIRGPVVGRKNHYGSKSRRGTEIAATFYTLIEKAKLAGVDPAAYLRAAALADAHGEVLLPADMLRCPSLTVTAILGSTTVLLLDRGDASASRQRDARDHDRPRERRRQGHGP